MPSEGECVLVSRSGREYMKGIQYSTAKAFYFSKSTFI